MLGAPGRFLLTGEDAGAIFERVVQTVRTAWRPAMRRAGASARDCAAIGSAFVPEGLFFEMDRQDPR